MNETASSLVLRFVGRNEPQLEETTFRRGPSFTPITAYRAEHYSKDIPTFDWRYGTQALCFVFLKYVIENKQKGVTEEFRLQSKSSGVKDKPAPQTPVTTLVELLAKRHLVWLRDMFGVQESGAPYARRILYRNNCGGRRWASKISIRIARNVLSPDNIQIYWDSKGDFPIKELSTLSRLCSLIETQWAKGRKNYDPKNIFTPPERSLDTSTPLQPQAGENRNPIPFNVEPRPDSDKNSDLRRRTKSLSRPWYREIERACGNKIKILGDFSTAPEMKRVGKYPFPPELKDAYKRNFKINKEESKGWNERIAEFKGLTQGGTVMEYEEYEYLQWKTLREAGLKPRSIYAGAILVCPEMASIYVHKRSPNVATEPNKFHSFAGGYIVDHEDKSDDTLLNACLRELHEESSSQPNLDYSRAVIVENLDIGWIDVMFMGGTISHQNSLRIKGSKEGRVMKIPLTQIEKSICENFESWAISGVAHHLIWLKLGAPGAPVWFRQEQAPLLYKNICASITPK